ncbi:hypothetical protein LJR118_002058 [Acidovorax sp. LjRoot118]
MTPIVAGFGLWIAYQQWKTAGDKLRLELFDRREAIYIAATKSIGLVMMHGHHSQADEGEFLRGTASAQWLLGGEVISYFDKELWAKLVELSSLQSQLQGAVGEERTRLLKEQLELKKWIVAQHGRLEELFMPYLGFQHLQGK